MTSELQRDIERIQPLIPFDPEAREAWQRIIARLSPDREVVAKAVKREAAGWATYLSDFEAGQIADAAIKVMQGEGE